MVSAGDVGDPDEVDAPACESLAWTYDAVVGRLFGSGVLRLHQSRTIIFTGKVKAEAGLAEVAGQLRGPGAQAATSERMRDVVKRISRSPPAAKAVPATPPATPLALDEMLDLNAASRLRTALLERRGADLAVDASGVQHLGALCAQVLAAAAATWAADGSAFTISAASEPFGQGARLLGLQSILTSESIRA